MKMTGGNPDTSNYSILSMLASVLILLGIVYMIFKLGKEFITHYNTSSNTSSNTSLNQGSETTTLLFPSYPYNNIPVDTLENPYMPPLRDERYLVPINVSTNIGAVDTNYRQLGILTPLNGQRKDNILPLMGRPLFVNRGKWQYYAISNQHNNVKLPLLVKGRTALTDTGVDQIYTGDTVYTEGYNEPFQVTLYENDTIRYL